MKEKFPNLVKEIDMQVPSIEKHRESQTKWMQRGIINTHPRHIIIEMPKVKDKERILKAAREKQLVIFRTSP